MKKILFLLLLIPCFVFGQTTDATLTTQSQQIKNETTPGANTADRVGTLFQNLTYSKKSFFIDGTASGTDTYSVTLDNGAVTALSSQWFVIKFTNTNTGAATLNINAIGAKDLVKTDGSALSSGDIDAGSIHILSYDGTDLQVLSLGGGGGPSIVGAQDLFITAAAMWPAATSGSSTLTPVEMATSLFTIQSLDFDQSADENAQFQVSLPRNWNNGTVTFTVYWTAAAGSGTVEWEIKGAAYSNDDPLTGAAGTAVEIDDTLIATNDLHVSPTSSAMTFAGSPADADFLFINIMRDVSDDTLNADAKLLGVRVTITLDAATSE